MLTVEQIKEIASKQVAATIKYVRVKEEFRYAVAGGAVEHRHLVQDGEMPTSAGFFSFKEDFLFLHNTPSISLQLGPLEEDAHLLKTIFLT